jgi:hypothetical protein
MESGRHAVIVDGSAQRNACACRLRHPPGVPDPWVAASHHAAPQIIHEQGRNLRRCVNRTRMRERPLQRVALHAVSSAQGTARGPRVKHRRSMARSHQPVPNLPFARRLIRFRHGWFHRGVQNRVAAKRNGFASNSVPRVCTGRCPHFGCRSVRLDVLCLYRHLHRRGGFQLSRRRSFRYPWSISSNSIAAEENKRGEDQCPPQSLQAGGGCRACCN